MARQIAEPVFKVAADRELLTWSAPLTIGVNRS
jgi:hypothetical protein